jgi:O-antigen ligase/tetratricopeptide (TPR) repeat protein
MEVIVFLLLIVWMGKLLCSSIRGFPFHRFALPLLLFIGLALVQMLPLPPAVLRVLSPSTYTLYATSLPGWPEKNSYSELSSTLREGQEAEAESQAALWHVLPTIEEVQRGVPVPFASPESAALPQPEDEQPAQLVTFASFPGSWRSLSLASALTKTDLLKFCAYTALFWLVCCYPFSVARPREGSFVIPGGRGKPEEQEAERRFFRTVLMATVSSGVLIACIGLLQQVTWNGKLLWFFVPYDWGAPRPDHVPRASGPFVNPDHFANYLMLSFPLAIVGALSPSLFSPEKRRRVQLFCGGAAFVLGLGILLSLSRGGWLATLLAVSILLWAFRLLPREQQSARRGSNKMRAAAIVLILVGGLALFGAGASGREQIASRLQETLTGDTSQQTRLIAWQGTFAMIHDFPLLGVGLGAWPELFPHYRRPPWSPLFYREAHNDYLELVAETGLLGGVLLVWFFLRSGRGVARGLRTASPQVLPYLAALLAACGGMAVHEVVDANLQTPANALLFTVFFGLVLRLTAAKELRDQSQNSACPPTGKRWGLGPVAFTAATSLMLLTVALRQQSLSYPHDAGKEPASLAEAGARMLSHPTRASGHFALAQLLQESAPPARWLAELRIAAWLDPGNPAIHDCYAHSLLQNGQEQEGLRELSQSVFFSPRRSTHAYLEPRLLPWLSAKEHGAVEEGFQQAVAFGLEDAVPEFGAFYHTLGRFAEEGALYETAALRYFLPRARADRILRAARAYVRAGALDKAEALFRQAAELIPTDPGPYHYLALWIFAPHKDLRSAQLVIAEGIRQGADPFALALTLAEAAKKIGNLEEAEAALLRALTLRPSSYDVQVQLGLLYLQQGRAARAALALRQASELNPQAAEAFYHLGVAEETRYQFFAAEKAYARAVALAPDNRNFRKRYEELLQKMNDQSPRTARR